MAQAPQGFGETVGVGGVQAGIQAGVVVEQAVENVGRLPRGAGDDLGGEDADAIADVGVDGDGLVVVAEVAGVVGADEGARRRAEALAIRGGQAAVAPDRGEVEPVVMLDDLGIGGLQGGVAHQPAGGQLEIRGGQVLDAVAHGGQAEVGAVGDQGGEEGAVGVLGARLVTSEWAEGPGEAAAPVDVEQDVLDPHPGHPALDLTAQATDLRRQGQAVGPAQAQLALLEPGEIVGGQPADEGCGGLRDVALQAGEVLGRPLGQAEIGVGARPGGRPQPLVQNQRPEPGMAAAVGQMQIAGPQCVPDRQRERRFPDRTPQPAAVVPQDLSPAGGDEVGRRILGQDLDLALIEAADQVDRPQQPVLSGVGDESQGQEGWQGFAQIRVAGEDGVDHTTAVMDRDRLPELGRPLCPAVRNVPLPEHLLPDLGVALLGRRDDGGIGQLAGHREVASGPQCVVEERE